MLEKYSRGWRGAPAKGVGRVTGARVQIPLSPLGQWELSETSLDSFFTAIYDTGKCMKRKVEKRWKNILTLRKIHGIIYKLSQTNYLKDL